MVGEEVFFFARSERTKIIIIIIIIIIKQHLCTGYLRKGSFSFQNSLGQQEKFEVAGIFLNLFTSNCSEGEKYITLCIMNRSE